MGRIPCEREIQLLDTLMTLAGRVMFRPEGRAFLEDFDDQMQELETLLKRRSAE